MIQIKIPIEVGNKFVIDGRSYWVTEVGQNNIGFMPDPDDPKHYFGPDNSGKTDWGNFWRIFFCIIFTAIIIRMIF